MVKNITVSKLKCALISVYDKVGVAELAKVLSSQGYSIIATEGTGKELTKNCIPFISADQVTQNPEVLRDCIQTISFRVAGGILFDRSKPKHRDQVDSSNIYPIDIVVCNFPPVAETVLKPSDFNIQHVDLGGPLMVRAAAINYPDVLAVVDPDDYNLVAKAVMSDTVTKELKRKLSIKAFRYTSAYDETIVDYLEDAS